MAMFNGLLIASFLILLAASVAVVGSMVALGLFDLAFGKKRTAPIAVETAEQGTDRVEHVELNAPASNVGAKSDNTVVPFRRTGQASSTGRSS
jgi:hypothetical protein